MITCRVEFTSAAAKEIRKLDPGAQTRLLACMDDASAAWVGLSQQSRRRVRALVKVLSEQNAPWVAHDRVVQALGRESLDELAALASWRCDTHR